MKHRYFFVFVINLLTFSLAAAPIRIQHSTEADNLFSATELLEVPAGRVSVNQLLQEPDGYRFVPTQNQLIKPKDRRYGYWLRFAITNEMTESLFLHFVYVGTEHISVYEVANNRVVDTHRLGMLQPETRYPFLKSNAVCPTQVQKGQTHTFYVYMEGVHTTALPIFCRTTNNLLEALHLADLFYGLYYGFILIIIVYSLILYFRLREKDTLLYAIWVIFIGLQLALFRGHTSEFLWPSNSSIERYAMVLAGITGMTHILFTIEFLRLRQQASLFYKISIGIFVLYAVGTLIDILSVSNEQPTGQQIDIVPLITVLEGIFSILAAIIIYRRGFRPALFYAIGNLLFFASIYVFLVYSVGRLPHSFWTYNSIHIGSGVEIILFTLALTYKVNLLKRNQEQAVREQLRLTEANQRLVEEQNIMLEEKVNQRTNELNQQKDGLQKTLEQLRTTQDQLIQKEKMASLGELTVGIAHEIQNPLNFVKNFSDVSAELVGELEEEQQKATRDSELEADLLSDLKKNLEKISHHSDRASAIVRGMSEHTRTGTGEKRSTNLNTLADEYLKIAYHGQLAKDKDFTCALVTNFAPNLNEIEVMPQEIGRVLLNLYNNAFYAVQEKQKKAPPDYQPTITVNTAQVNGHTEIRVGDNGTGIPEMVITKVFQPFFTTKPTGEGTGLGLSLSYDIITKGHGGELLVESKAGQGSEFVIQLPTLEN